jgi:hypothetical protein
MWFELWQKHIELAVSRKQQLQVVFFEGYCGRGRISSWEECRVDALRRESMWRKREQFLLSLPEVEVARLQKLPSKAYTSQTLRGTERSKRWDAEEKLFLSSLPLDERAYLKSQVGLGNSQKAEVEKCWFLFISHSRTLMLLTGFFLVAVQVAWLEKRFSETGNEGYRYEEVDVRAFRRRRR